jgi:hypothetical protein
MKRDKPSLFGSGSLMIRSPTIHLAPLYFIDGVRNGIPLIFRCTAVLGAVNGVSYALVPWAAVNSCAARSKSEKPNSSFSMPENSAFGRKVPQSRCGVCYAMVGNPVSEASAEGRAEHCRAPALSRSTWPCWRSTLSEPPCHPLPWRFHPPGGLKWLDGGKGELRGTRTRAA